MKIVIAELSENTLEQFRCYKSSCIICCYKVLVTGSTDTKHRKRATAEALLQTSKSDCFLVSYSPSDS